MRTFRQLRESTAKVAVITFGRFNPPTIGHAKMINRIIGVAKRNGGHAFIFASGSQDAKKNPLPYDEKIQLMKKMFPNRQHNFFKFAANKPPTVMHAASMLFEDGYEELIMVVGSDRVNQFKKLLPDYNGVEGKPHGFYNFQKITIESAGERDPDADGAEGMSASKMRQFAIDGNYDAFAEGMPDTLSDRDKRAAYASLRKNMRLRVIESVIRKDVKVEPIVEKHEKIVQFDNLVEYLYQLPYQKSEKIYINKINDHIDCLIKEQNYYQAKHHVNKIKSYIDILNQQSGMIDFTVCDLSLFEDYLDQYDRKEVILKPLSERLQNTIKEAEFERAAAALAMGLAAKYGYDKFIKQKFSVKAKIKSLEDKIDSLKDKKRKIDNPDKRKTLIDQIAKLELALEKERKKVSDLNTDIAKAKERQKKDGGEGQKERDKKAKELRALRIKNKLAKEKQRKDAEKVKELEKSRKEADKSTKDAAKEN